MTALLTASLPEFPDRAEPPARTGLRLVEPTGRFGPRRVRSDDAGHADGVVRAPLARPHYRRVPIEVRRRRTLLAIMGLALTLLALPLGGFGGTSHSTGSALAANGRPVSYTVRPGDTLWSIAERVDPDGDPRPIVSQLAAQLDSYTVHPGERLQLP